MAEAVKIDVAPRKAKGKWAVRRLRRQGWVPGIVYGGDREPVMVQIPARELERLARHHERLVSLVGVEEQPVTGLVREIQWDVFGKEIIHVDFHRVVAGQRVTVEVPVVLRGVPKGVDAGGVLEQSLHEVEIECLATEIPEQIRVDVSGLDLEDVLYASALPLPEGVTLVTEPEVVVAVVTRPAAVQAEEEEAEAAEPAASEPQVIEKGKKEKEAEA